MRKEKEEYKTELICPITGSFLWCTGNDIEVRDGYSWYSPESDSSIIFARSPFSWNIFLLMDRRSMMSKPIRYFKLNEDNTWTELKRVPYGDKLFPINTPDDDPEWKKEVADGIEWNRKRREQEKYWDEHPEEDPRVHARTIAMDQVEVKPLSSPRGGLYYLDFKYGDTLK